MYIHNSYIHKYFIRVYTFVFIVVFTLTFVSLHHVVVWFVDISFAFVPINCIVSMNLCWRHGFVVDMFISVRIFTHTVFLLGRYIFIAGATITWMCSPCRTLLLVTSLMFSRPPITPRVCIKSTSPSERTNDLNAVPSLHYSPSRSCIFFCFWCDLDKAFSKIVDTPCSFRRDTFSPCIHAESRICWRPLRSWNEIKSTGRAGSFISRSKTLFSRSWWEILLGVLLSTSAESVWLSFPARYWINAINHLAPTFLCTLLTPPLPILAPPPPPSRCHPHPPYSHSIWWLPVWSGWQFEIKTRRFFSSLSFCSSFPLCVSLSLSLSLSLSHSLSLLKAALVIYVTRLERSSPDATRRRPPGRFHGHGCLGNGPSVSEVKNFTSGVKYLFILDFIYFGFFLFVYFLFFIFINFISSADVVNYWPFSSAYRLWSTFTLNRWH